jgi:ATP synthase protein I
VIFLDKKKQSSEEEFLEKIKKDSEEKIKSQDEGKKVMFGLGMFGLVGWSIAIPTIMGIAFGLFLDKRFTQSFSWTITFLFVGVILGSFNAWRWLKEKSRDD